CEWKDGHGPSCGMWVGGDKQDIREHLQKWHGVKRGQDKDKISCLWSSCSTRLRKESLWRHIRTVHLALRWKCEVCNIQYTREDAAQHKHK
ncbi:hypothetical protein BU15DRAFT_8921, partial [Melanogaster broomeanus]